MAHQCSGFVLSTLFWKVNVETAHEPAAIVRWAGRAKQRTGAQRAVGGRAIDRGAAHLDRLQFAISSLRPGHGQPRQHLANSRIVLERDHDGLAGEGQTCQPRRASLVSLLE